MSNSLELADLDDVELIEDIGEAFDLKLNDDEVGSCETVGDLYEMLLSRLPRTTTQAGPCLSAAVFYRLRRTITRLEIESSPRPKTPLIDLVGRYNSKQRTRRSERFWHDLERETRLRLPRLDTGWIGGIVFLGLIFGGLVLGFGWSPWAFLMAPLAVVALRLWPQRLPSHIATLGDLAKVTAGLNYGALARESATYRKRDIWQALDTVIRETTLFTRPIDRGTRFF